MYVCIYVCALVLSFMCIVDTESFEIATRAICNEGLGCPVAIHASMHVNEGDTEATALTLVLTKSKFTLHVRLYDAECVLSVGCTAGICRSLYGNAFLLEGRVCFVTQSESMVCSSFCAFITYHYLHVPT